MSIEKFKKVLSVENDTKKTVSFNYPKYQEKGTPHNIWLDNVAKVEKDLEMILEEYPLQEIYPLIYMRREDNDELGQIIRVHFDLFGKKTAIEGSLYMLRHSEDRYVFLNLLNSEESGAELKKAIEELGLPMEVVTGEKIIEPAEYITMLDAASIKAEASGNKSKAKLFATIKSEIEKAQKMAASQKKGNMPVIMPAVNKPDEFDN